MNTINRGRDLSQHQITKLCLKADQVWMGPFYTFLQFVVLLFVEPMDFGHPEPGKIISPTELTWS